MAVERLFSSIQEGLVMQAADLSTEGVELLKEGKTSEGRLRLQRAIDVIDRSEKVNGLVPDILAKLRAVGIEQPPEDYLTRLHDRQPILPSPAPVSPFAALRNYFSRLIPQRRDEVSMVAEVTTVVAHTDELVTTPVSEETISPPTITPPPAERETQPRRGRPRKATTPPAPTTDIKEAKIQVSGKEVGRKRGGGIGGDLVEVEDKIIRARLAINPGRTGFGYPSVEEISKLAFPGSTAGGRKLVSPTMAAIGRAIKKLDASTNKGPESVPPRIAELFVWINGQSEYADLSFENLVRVLRGDVSFEQVKKRDFGVSLPGPSDESEIPPVAPPAPPGLEPEGENKPLDPKLTDQEIYSLARKLSESSEVLTRVGITIGEDDREMLASTINAYRNKPGVKGSDSQTDATLLWKLSAFVKDKQKTFLAQGDNEDAQFLLTFFARKTSEENLKQFFEPEPVGGKNN